MARSLGGALPATLVQRFSQSDLRPLLGRALPLITVDADGRPHPMLCSYLELRAVSPTLLRLAIAARSGSARNLEDRGVATLLVIEPEQTIFIKCRASGAPLLTGELARFELTVEDVSEDAAAEWEAGAGITSGIIYAPVPDLGSPEARAILTALRA
jgi:flavin reductase (DIM6/NTAB) family NADH-FMN oxidoreductase RutF